MTSLPLDDPRAARILGWMADHLRRFPEEYEKAKIVTLDRVGSKLNQEAIRTLAKRYTAKRADISRKIKVTKASSAKPFVMVRGEGRPIHMGLWPQKTVKLYSLKSGRALKGVRVRELKESGFEFVQGGFVGVSSKNRHTLVFKRKGKSRYPIEALHGPSMIGHLTHEENQEPLMTMAQSNLELELQRQAQFRLKRLGIL